MPKDTVDARITLVILPQDNPLLQLNSGWCWLFVMAAVVVLGWKIGVDDTAAAAAKCAVWDADIYKGTGSSSMAWKSIKPSTDHWLTLYDDLR